MSFLTQRQAKKFFIDKILLQAQKDNIPLSEEEKYMLNWTETEEGFEFNQELNDKFERNHPAADYENKITNLIRKAYTNDINNDANLKQNYFDAQKILSKGDYYILIMIDAALQLSSKSTNWIKDKILLILIGLCIIIVPVSLAILLPMSDEWRNFISYCFYFLIIYFIYSYFVFSLKSEPFSSKLKIYIFQLIVVGVLISTYAILIQHNAFNIRSLFSSDSFSYRNREKELIVLIPLLGIAIFLLDFWLKKGLVYDSIIDLVHSFRERFNQTSKKKNNRKS